MSGHPSYEIKATQAAAKRKPGKNSGLNRIQFVTSAMPVHNAPINVEAVVVNLTVTCTIIPLVMPPVNLVRFLFIISLGLLTQKLNELKETAET